jgi:hypothetical protein
VVFRGRLPAVPHAQWRSVAAEAVAEEAGDAADRGHADAGQFVNAPVGQVLLQKLYHLPAVDQRLQLRRRAQVLEEIAALGTVLQRNDCRNSASSQRFAVFLESWRLGFTNFGAALITGRACNVLMC